MEKASRVLILICFTLLLTSTHQYHPLDPLTPSELNQVRTIVKGSNISPGRNLTFHYVGLDEPDKSTILSWLPDQTRENPPRRAFVIIRANQETHEIVVDLSTNSTILDQVYGGNGYPLLNFEEQIAASKLATTYAPFIASIGKRGLKVEEVVCGSFTIGWYGEEERTNRVVRVMCYYLDGTVNLYMRPIEGITVTVDLDTMEIVRYYDRMVIPVPKAEGTDYRESEQKPPFVPSVKAVTVVQPEGPSFSIDGNTIR